MGRGIPWFTNVPGPSLNSLGGGCGMCGWQSGGFCSNLFSAPIHDTDRHDWDGDSEMSPAWFGPGKIERKPRFYHPCDGIDLLMVSKWVLGPLCNWNIHLMGYIVTGIWKKGWTNWSELIFRKRVMEIWWPLWVGYFIGDLPLIASPFDRIWYNRCLLVGDRMRILRVAPTIGQMRATFGGNGSFCLYNLYLSSFPRNLLGCSIHLCCCHFTHW